MIIEMFMFLETLMIILFLISFFMKQELLWVITAVLSGVLAFTSYNIEKIVYVANTTINLYTPTVVSYSYPYLMGINLLFFALALILFIFDLFDKYRWKAFPKLMKRLKQ